MSALEIINDRKAPQGQRVKTVGQFLEANADTVFGALPKQVTRERMIAVTLSSLRKNPALLNCDPLSLFAAVTEAANLGLIPDGVLGQAYLVPYKEECVLIPGYKGLIDLARRSSTISTIRTAVVRKGDEFEWREGDDPCLRHTPSPDADYLDDEAITHAYMIAVLRDGGVQRNCWPVAKIKAHARKYSASFRSGKKDSPWITAFEAMARKTVVRESIGRGELPVSVELQSLACREELYEHREYQEQQLAMPGRSLDSITSELDRPFPPDESQSSSEQPEQPAKMTDEELFELESEMQKAANACTSLSDITKFRKTYGPKHPKATEAMASMRLENISTKEEVEA